jgi:hypothetical protein
MTTSPNVFDAIRMRIENSDGIYPSKFNLHYRLPIGVGTTTFLLNLSMELAEEGKQVIFVTPSKEIANALRQKITWIKNRPPEIVTLSDNSFCGYSPDLIIIDTCHNHPEYQAFMQVMCPVYASSNKTNILRIDSIDF